MAGTLNYTCSTLVGAHTLNASSGDLLKPQSSRGNGLESKVLQY